MSPTLNEISTDAILYWERMRIAYNLALAVVSLHGYVTSPDNVRPSFSVPAALFLLLLVVAANVLYSTAYLPDMLIQVSQFRDLRHRFRPVLFTIGTSCGCALAYLISHPVSGS